MNQNSTSYCAKCHPSCKECTSNQETQCKENSCNTGYYITEGESKNHCTKLKIGYFISSENPPIQKKCDTACSECKEGPTKTDTKCTVCNIAGLYYPSYESNSNCLKSETGAYLDLDQKKFVQCPTGCLECNKDTSNPNNKVACTRCDSENNYFFVSKSATCEQTEQKEHYYYDRNEYSYKPCHQSCLTCTEGGNDINNNCLLCDTDNSYYPVYGESKQCTNGKEGYYFDKGEKNFKPCYGSCLKCSGPNKENCIFVDEMGIEYEPYAPASSSSSSVSGGMIAGIIIGGVAFISIIIAIIFCIKRRRSSSSSSTKDGGKDNPTTTVNKIANVKADNVVVNLN